MNHPIHITMIVIPFFNEEKTLADTCFSLGFGHTKSNQNQNEILILVNNNSTDNSLQIVEKIQKNSLSQTVYLINELEQGFVPARHKGNLLAKEIAKMKNISEDNILIIQADADTFYSDQYCIFLKNSMERTGLNSLIEAYTTYPSSYIKQEPLFLKHCRETDIDYETFFVNEDSDVIVDDKAASYRLFDYFMWGGHVREYNASGSEIYAETSRLFIKAKSMGAVRKKVEGAFVIHSIRKIIEKPLSSFVTAGFPREESWINGRNASLEILDLKSLRGNSLDNAKKTRALHLLAIFCILPAHVSKTIGHKIEHNVINIFALKKLPERNIMQLRDFPAMFFEDVFKIIDIEGECILELV